jgi:hypothetical protein
MRLGRQANLQPSSVGTDAMNKAWRFILCGRLTIVRRAVMREGLGAVGAERDYGPTALIGRFCAALQLHR